ncbi:MAG: hypothetical protein K2L70_03640 [Clostridia bacterium]|nr:hypothetical protein [Clostridia bacterium]
MSEYDVERQQQLIAEYNRLVDRANSLRAENNRLTVEVDRCQDDVVESIGIIEALNKAVPPRMEVSTDETIKKEVIAANVSRTIDDLAQSYRLLKISSTASKNLTSSTEKYYTLYRTYNDLRKVSLGYVVGLDSNLWTSDIPRQTVEKMYVANTDYWLAYATMAVMLWASNEEDACQRAISRSMLMNERKSSLFFLLASLRFDRIDAAKEWYKVYFKIVDANGVGDEIIYILQALLSGALGSDPDFANEVGEKMRELIVKARSNSATKRLVSESIDNHIQTIISVTDKEYIALKHICVEYDQMLNLVSSAEKNEMIKKYFLSIAQSDFSLKNRLAERIEDSLYSLISTYDDPEQQLVDKISYEEAVVKANGRTDVAKQAYDKMIAERDNKNNMALILTDAALNSKMQTDSRVRKFCLNSIQQDCIDGVERFAQYRKNEKQEYDLIVDGCQLKGDENSFETNQSKLLSYYDSLIKRSIKEDKSHKTCIRLLIGSVALFALFLLLSIVGFASKWNIGASVTLLIFAILAVGVGVLMGFMKADQKKKIKKAFEYRIQNGVKMLKNGLEDMAQWRKYYKEQDAIYEELMQVLKEEI